MGAAWPGGPSPGPVPAGRRRAVSRHRVRPDGRRRPSPPGPRRRCPRGLGRGRAPQMTHRSGGSSPSRGHSRSAPTCGRFMPSTPGTRTSPPVAITIAPASLSSVRRPPASSPAAREDRRLRRFLRAPAEDPAADRERGHLRGTAEPPADPRLPVAWCRYYDGGRVVHRARARREGPPRRRLGLRRGAAVPAPPRGRHRVGHWRRALPPLTPSGGRAPAAGG